MNFKENYQREMNAIEKPADITEKVLNAVDMEQEIYTDKKKRIIPESSAVRKTAVATIAIACVLGLCLQHEKITSFAQSALNYFSILSVNNEPIELDTVEPIKINMEGFFKGEPPEPELINSHLRFFSSYQQMNQLTQLELPCADKVEYGEIALDLMPKYKTGRVYADILYKDTSYAIAGMFKLDGFEEEGFNDKDWGYGAKGSKEIYQYGDGKSACFVKEDGTDRVYFAEGNILFQLSFGYCNDPDCEDETCTRTHHVTSKKQVKKLLKLFGREN